MELPSIKHGVAGYFKAHAFRPSDGRIRELAPWQKNLITNNGMNRLAGNLETGQFYNTLAVGSGTTAPSFTDVALVAQVAQTTNAGAPDNTNADVGVPEPYVMATKIYTFGIGAAAGNLTELGLRGSNNLSAPLFTRALFRDASGTPTTIVVQPDEQLIVTYQLRVYIPTAKSTATVVNPGNGVSYTIEMLPTGVGARAGVSLMMAGGMFFGIASQTNQWVYSGATSGTLGSIANEPSGTRNVAAATATGLTYVPDSYQRDFTITWGLTAANFADIGGFALSSASSQNVNPIAWQWTVSPKITKTADQTLSFTFRLILVRA